MSEHNVKSPKRGVVIWLKTLLFLLLFAAFFGVYAVPYPWVIDRSRTAAITMPTFVVFGILMLTVYGGYAVGKKKSKEIIPSLCLAILFTDLFTYFQLAIMNTNQWTRYHFSFATIWMLLIVFPIQAVTIWAFVYLGNFLFFKINPPEECLVVCSDLSVSDELTRRVGRYKKQYHIANVINWEDPRLKTLIRNSDTVFIYDVPAEVKIAIIDYAYKHYVNIYFQTELSDIVTNYAKYTVIDDLALLCSATKELSPEQRFIKRLLDIIFSALILIVLSPLMLIEALAIKLYDGGPVFFKQKRATLNGKEFNVLKFRTMIVDADKKEGFHPAGENDDRITPVGKVLRKLRLDELPQFFNILSGDMSVVGPRPERIEHVEIYTQELPEFEYRLRAKAGLTGLAQIAGKYNTTPKDKLILDLMYIEKYSVWMDIQLVFQTLKVFFKSDSTEAFSEDKVDRFIKYQEDELLDEEKEQQDEETTKENQEKQEIEKNLSESEK